MRDRLTTMDKIVYTLGFLFWILVAFCVPSDMGGAGREPAPLEMARNR